MTAPMILFAGVTLLPVPLIAAAALWGGLWVLAALAVLTALVASLDEVVTWVAPAAEDVEFPAATALLVALAGAHLALMGLVVWQIGRSHDLGSLEKAGIYWAAGLFFGQVSNSMAHELIHRAGRGLRRLGVLVYVSMLYGHHASAHPLVHHVAVATRDDPATARRGESFYRYVRRAWPGNFRAGWAAERARLDRTGAPLWRHPYVAYLAGSLACAAVALGLGGVKGLAVWIGLAAFAQTQLLMSDYVQHYGLERVRQADGRLEPAGPAHSWNSPHLLSSALMLNAPRHSDHHAHPGRAYPALRLEGALPMLPRSLPVMSCVALYPRLWRRVMDPLAARWR